MFSRWHPLLWLVVAYASLALALALFDVDLMTESLVVPVLSVPFLVSLTYGAYLSAARPALLERLAVPWHALIWIVSAAVTILFAVWAVVLGPPAALSTRVATNLWLPALVVPALASLACGGYVISRLFRGVRTRTADRNGGLGAALRIAAALPWIGTLLFAGGAYTLALVVLAFTAIAAFEQGAP